MVGCYGCVGGSIGLSNRCHTQSSSTWMRRKINALSFTVLQ